MYNVLLVLDSFWPTTAEGWISLVTFIVGFVAAILTLVPVAIKLFKKCKELIKTKNWDKIKEIADAAMEEAEASGKSGADKKEMVVNAVKAGCEEAGIEIGEEELNNLADYIDVAIDWFNKMLSNNKSKK